MGRYSSQEGRFALRPYQPSARRVYQPRCLRNGQALRTEVRVAETPELPIPRGSAGLGMLTDTVVKRWQDHLPLHRLEAIFRREGIELNRSTVCSSANS